MMWKYFKFFSWVCPWDDLDIAPGWPSRIKQTPDAHSTTPKSDIHIFWDVFNHFSQFDLQTTLTWCDRGQRTSDSKWDIACMKCRPLIGILVSFLYSRKICVLENSQDNLNLRYQGTSDFSTFPKFHLGMEELCTSQRVDKYEIILFSYKLKSLHMSVLFNIG